LSLNLGKAKDRIEKMSCSRQRKQPKPCGRWENRGLGWLKHQSEGRERGYAEGEA